VIEAPCLEGRDRYERVMDAWVDNTHDDAFTHAVRIADDDRAIEVSAVCTPAPAYEVRGARARVRSGPVDPDLATAFSGLAGARMVAGFTRRLADLCGSRDGAAFFIDAGVEIARLARQVTRLPPDATAGFVRGDAVRCWALDSTAWSDLPGSCFTYGPTGQALLGTPNVFSQAGRELYTPPPGALKIFTRRRLVRVVRTGDRLHLFHALHDNVHGFDVHCEIDLPSERIAAAESVISRLPYSGICSEPQLKIAALTGLPVDAGLRKRLTSLVGGSTGCAQLYDLLADLLKFLSFR